MGQSDPTFKRLQIILVLFIFVLCFDAGQAFLLNDSSSYESLTGSTGTQLPTDEPEESAGLNIGFVFDFIGFFFGGFLFKLPLLAGWMIVFLLPMYLIVMLSFWYLVIDFIKDITFLGSHL